jgi:hypothetical protein
MCAAAPPLASWREIADDRIAGFYTLTAGGVLLAQMPVRLAKRLPRYPSVPVARLGRLAVALACHGRKLGGALLWDALRRSSRSEVAVYAIAVDAKDEPAERPSICTMASFRSAERRELSSCPCRRGREPANRQSQPTLTSISSLFRHFQIRKAETDPLPCYTCAQGESDARLLVPKPGIFHHAGL